MKIACTNFELVNITKLKPHPKNPNKHSKDQIKRLAKILDYQGFRNPIKVSNQSGFIISGHGRLAAAKLNKWKQVPVSYQDYENQDQEYADLIADNAIADWAELDLQIVNEDFVNLGPDFDIDLLGIDGFILDPTSFEPGTEQEQSKLDKTQLLECPHCGKPLERSQAKIID